MLDDPTRNLGFLLYDSARLLRRDFDRRARELGLGRAQWSVLAHLARNEGVVQAELADILEVQPITLARQVDRLEAEGLVQRCQDPSDRRVRRLYLTDAAHPLLERLRAVGTQTRGVALEGLGAEERERLLNLLARVRDNLKNNCHAAAGHTNGDPDRHED